MFQLLLITLSFSKAFVSGSGGPPETETHEAAKSQTLEERVAALEAQAQQFNDDIFANRIKNDEQSISINSNLLKIDLNIMDIMGITGSIQMIDETRPPIGAIVPWMGPTWVVLPEG